jgi:hypothetical protein
LDGKRVINDPPAPCGALVHRFRVAFGKFRWDKK